MNSGNWFLKEKRFVDMRAVSAEGHMTFSGTMNKTALLFVILLAGASLTWVTPTWGDALPPISLMLVGLFGGLILALVTAFNMGIARITAPIYAFCEGLFLGGISSMLEFQFPGIVLQAMVATLALFAGIYITFRSGLVKVSQRFRNGVIGATMGLALFYLVAMIFALFGIRVPLLFSGGSVGILFSLGVVVLATLNLVLDFDMVQQMSEAGAPKHIEWYGAFALMVTLVWLYIEILRLIARLRR